jgi:NADH dehydrogenase FAD-containing subunit
MLIKAKARGRIVTDNWLRVLGAEGVYSIGDCAMMQDSPLPATAQVESKYIYNFLCDFSGLMIGFLGP